MWHLPQVSGVRACAAEKSWRAWHAAQTSTSPLAPARRKSTASPTSRGALAALAAAAGRHACAHATCFSPAPWQAWQLTLPSFQRESKVSALAS